ncbi:hypothetical protein QTP88_017063 [Uroleucon formosanum]
MFFVFAGFRRTDELPQLYMSEREGPRLPLQQRVEKNCRRKGFHVGETLVYRPGRSVLFSDCGRQSGCGGEGARLKLYPNTLSVIALRHDNGTSVAVHSTTLGLDCGGGGVCP